jgi:hypothetical protein
VKQSIVYFLFSGKNCLIGEEAMFAVKLIGLLAAQQRPSPAEAASHVT